MPWIVRNEPEHVCALPNCDSVGFGSIWECPKCKRQFVVAPGRVGKYLKLLYIENEVKKEDGMDTEN